MPMSCEKKTAGERREMMATDKTKPLHIQVAEKLIEQLRAGTSPFQKPWSTDGIAMFQLPYNAVTGNRYKGINIFSLLLKNYEDPRWMTFKQATANEWKVKKGEKASLIQFVKTSDQITKRDENGKPVLNEEGKPTKIFIKLDRPIITTAWVFNAVQVEGVPKIQRKNIGELGWDPVDRAEKLIASSGAEIFNRAGDEAFYNVLADNITLPLKQQFDVPEKYYSTALHELGHWTGHKDRLDRSIMNAFGSEGYAREELRAEIASLLIGQELRIGHDLGQHAAYVGSWIKLLEDMPFEIHAAAADAEKIFNYLTALEQKRELENEIELPAEIKNTKNKTALGHLTMGEQIEYNNTIFKVNGYLKQARYRMEDLGTGNNFILSRSDKLYSSLLHAKQNLERQIGSAQDAVAQKNKENENAAPQIARR